jgi:DNA-binding transcriptional LysR family regulator
VAENRAEIGFGFDLGESPDLVSVQLGLSSLVCVCPEGHALARRENVSPADILPYRLISFSKSLAIGEAIDAAFTDSGHARRFSIDVGQSFAACALVAAGAGVTVVDALTASTWRQPGIVVRPFAPSRPLRISAVFPAQRQLSLAAKALLDSMMHQSRQP